LGTNGNVNERYMAPDTSETGLETQLVLEENARAVERPIEQIEFTLVKLDALGRKLQRVHFFFVINEFGGRLFLLARRLLLLARVPLGLFLLYWFQEWNYVRIPMLTVFSWSSPRTI
jgi:hypothetical protein